MRVTLVQTPLDWANPAANRQRMTRLLAPLAGATDLVVLPETFTTGFDMQGGASAELMGGATCEWLRAQARHLDAAVLGSAFIRDEAGVHNRALWATPDGTLVHYDKRHLFRMGGEHECYAAGLEPLLVSWRGACIAPLICYDLRFPVWSRRRERYDYDLLVYVANWPAARHYAWQQLLNARARSPEDAMVCAALVPLARGFADVSAIAPSVRDGRAQLTGAAARSSRPR